MEMGGMQKPLSPLFFPFFEDNLPEAVVGAARSLLGSSGTLAERKATPAGAMGVAFFYLGGILLLTRAEGMVGLGAPRMPEQG